MSAVVRCSQGVVKVVADLADPYAVTTLEQCERLAETTPPSSCSAGLDPMCDEHLRAHVDHCTDCLRVLAEQVDRDAVAWGEL